MKINTKIRYGLRTVIEIAIHGNNGILQKEIAKKQHLSDKYLDHIIASLKAGGIITNVAGKGSGYMLTKAPEHISVYDVYRSFDNELSITNCLSALAHCMKKESCAAREFWHELNETMIAKMKQSNIADLARRELQLMEAKSNDYQI